ncbi:RNA polymerase sigma factor [bacterium]|nr:RNA polymerase sigma factor [bacterium]
MISEEELIKACKKNNRVAQKELFDRYSGKMLAVCLRYARNQEDARDLLQDGFFKVLTKIKSFKGNSKLETWMTRVFINLALNRLRQGRNKYYHEEFDQKHEAGLTDTEEELPQRDAKTVLKAVQELPEIYRIVINMYAIDGMSHKEISKALGITEGSSKSRLSRARVLLNEQLKSK